MKTPKEIADEIFARELEQHGIAGGYEETLALVEQLYVDAFRAGFEHAVAGGEDAASRQFEKLGTTCPLVLYFANETDRREMIDAIQMAHPNMVECRIPERRKS